MLLKPMKSVFESLRFLANRASNQFEIEFWCILWQPNELLKKRLDYEPANS